MVAELFLLAFLGHLTGDYIFQPKVMALRKSERTWDGFWLCAIHCLLYTIFVCLWMWRWDLVVMAAIFASHFVVDRFSLADKWNGLVGNRTFKGAFESTDKYREFDIAFSSI